MTPAAPRYVLWLDNRRGFAVANEAARDQAGVPALRHAALGACPKLPKKVLDTTPTLKHYGPPAATLRSKDLICILSYNLIRF